MSKHTNGPWCAAIDECATVRDSQDNQLAMVTYLFTKTGGRRSRDEVSANARLIATAPELLEALEAMLEVHGVTQAYAEKHIEIPQSWVEVSDLARAAIAKAKGEQ